MMDRLKFSHNLSHLLACVYFFIKSTFQGVFVWLYKYEIYRSVPLNKFFFYIFDRFTDLA